MLVIDVSQLRSAVAPPEVPPKFTFRGKNYVCRKKYSKPNLNAAILQCRKYLDEGYFCIVVEGASAVAVCLSSNRKSSVATKVKPTPPADQPALSSEAAELKQKYATGERNFRRLDLRNQNLAGLELTGANFSHSNLSGAKLNGTQLSGANLSHANLTNAILIDTDLRNANLTHVNLSGANITGTKLTGARLRGAIMPDGTS